MTFATHEAAHSWAMIHGRENCLPCHRWQIVVDEAHDRRQWRVAVFYKVSGEFVGYAE